MDEYRLIEPNELESALHIDASAGEFDLLDARNLMERGDYSGAVRRITTALEAIVEQVLGTELRKKYSEADVVRRLRASRNNFPARVREYEALTARNISAPLWAEIERTRSIRHGIVHRGDRIRFADRGSAQRAVDTGRWAFNWFENKPDRVRLRESKLAMRSIGRGMTVTVFDATLTPDGVSVHMPPYLAEGNA